MAERSSATSGAAARESGVPTFSFQVGNPTSQARPVSQGAPMRGGVRAQGSSPDVQLDHGGVARAGAQAAAISQRDLDTLMKFGGALAQKVQQKAEEGAYWEGVKKAATGQSIKEIVDEQPWYSQIFGQSPLVEGARAYTSQAKLDEALSDFTQRMPELRKVDPSQVTDTFIGRLDAMMTGDPVTDAVLKQSASQQLPLLLKQHAKEHYAYLQTNLKSTQFQSWQPAASHLQASAAGYAVGTVPEKDWQVLKDQALAKIVPLDGQTDESYKSNILAMYGKAAQDGNFHMVKLMDEAGVRQFLNPEQLRTVDDQLFRYGQRAKAEYASQYMAEDLAALKAAAQTGQIDPAATAKTARLMNEKFRRATGIDEDVINVETLTTTSAVQLFEDQKRGLNAQQMKEAKLANAKIAFSSGFGASAYADTGLSKTEADVAFRDAFRGAKDPTKFLVDNSVLAVDPYISPSIAGEIRATVQGSLQEEWNAGMESVYGNWKTIQGYGNGGEAAAAAYYGPVHAQLKAMQTLESRGIPLPMAYDRVFNKPVPPSPELTKANSKALEEAIKTVNQYDGLKSYFRWFVGRPLSDSGVRGLTAVLAPKFDQYMQLNPDADPVGVSETIAKAAVANGEVEMYGEYAWGKDPSQIPLSQYVGPVKEWASSAVEATVSAKLKASGATTVDSYTIWRAPDSNGEPMLYVQAIGDGAMTPVMVRGSEIKALYESTKKRKTTPITAPTVDWTAPVM